MSNIANTVKIAQDKDGMLRRALERIIQLYTDKSHFVYELLQNAEDAEAKSICFVQYSDRLEVFHDGRPFTTENLKGLCDIGKSDKVDNLNQIGEFGVGFKSVFGICDTVRLYSEPSHYRNTDIGDAIPFAVEIHDFTRPEDIEKDSISNLYTTKFVFPYSTGQSFSGFSSVKSLNDTLSQKLQNLGVTTLLFMKNLEQIEYRIKTTGEEIKGEYLLDKKIINDHCMLVSALGTSANDNQELDELIYYLMFTREVPKYGQRTVDIAFPVKIENDKYQCVKAQNPYVSVYFPTETESKLDFIVQGPYRTTPNRSSIPADDLDNRYLAQETSTLLKDSIVELKNAGKLNMSFLRVLPLTEERFSTFGLFLPLYSSIKTLFQTSQIIPTKSGEYVQARYAKISRQERLAILFWDKLLSLLINDGHNYHWLPTFLTETNREYKHVLEFMTSKLYVPVIRPEDLRGLFSANPQFLLEVAKSPRGNDWLAELYGIFENIPTAFSRTRNEANLLTAEIIKTSNGKIVAPFRREGKAYIPNVFLPSESIKSADIYFVDAELYNRCRSFFDNILQLQKPNEYEYLIKDLKNRYEKGLNNSDEQHIADIKMLLKYVKRDEYEAEVSRILREIFTLRCTDGKMRNSSSFRIFLPISAEGINIEGYYRNTDINVYFIDLDFYTNQGISISMLQDLGVLGTIVTGEKIVDGTYTTHSSGRQPTWWTTGDYRWKLSLDSLKDVLTYISQHPHAKDSLIKSQVIMKLLLANEKRLCGYLHISGNTIPNKENEPCEMIHILRGERMLHWDGKWLFTESGELVAPKSVSRHDISTSIYGRIQPDSIIFKLIGFKKTDADEVDELKKTIPQAKLEAFFESELLQRYGISVADLNAQYGSISHSMIVEEKPVLDFPTLHVRSWDALRKHAAEMLIYADPVRYEEKIRSIRVSNHPREARAYLSNMYRYDGSNRFKFACQLCHETCSSFESTELFLKPETELDPVNLCLCPNCAAAYRKMRSNSEIMSRVRKSFSKMKDSDIESSDYVAVPIDDDDELWFTQTHFAEIRELMRLAEEVKNSNSKPLPQSNNDDENEKSGLSVYSGYVGKSIVKKDGYTKDGYVGVVKKVDDQYIYVHVTSGKDEGKDKMIQLSFIIKKNGIYSFRD